MLQPAPEAVRDTLAAIFRQPAYERSLKSTLWSRFTGWVSDVLERLTNFTSNSPTLAWTLRALTVVAIVLVVARLAYVLWAQRPASMHARGRGGVAGAPGDPWMHARAEAAAGRYTEAAHLLYAALLEALARREQLRLHPSRTLGDYTRELRAKSSDALDGFRDFARSYETVVYDHQECDRERYELLHTLASRLVAPHG